MNRVRIVFCAYHDINSNGRCQEVLKAAEKIGQVTFVSYRTPSSFSVAESTDCIVSGDGKRSYIPFVRTCINQIKAISPDIVILHDNYCAAIVPHIRKIKSVPIIVYDSSELYIDKKPGGLSSTIAWLIQRCENKWISKANMVIAANLERAQIMKDYFKLQEMPYVFENVRYIVEEPNVDECDKKFGNIIKPDTFAVLYAGGISKNRMTYDLIRAVKSLGEGYTLLLAGQKDETESKLFEEAMHSTPIDNVYYFGYLKRSELRYLFQHVNISVSMFQQNTLNNINCASGKFFESIYEECPVLTSTNPPLKRLCEQYGFGLSTDDLKSGIVMMKDNYAYYKENAIAFKNTINPDDLVDKLSDEILKKYNICHRNRYYDEIHQE